MKLVNKQKNQAYAISFALVHQKKWPYFRLNENFKGFLVNNIRQQRRCSFISE